MWGTNIANGAIYKLGFDLLNDFEPIALVATQPFLIDARKTMPANNLKELIAWLKANGDKTTMGTSGVGSPSHVAGVLMENMLGLHWQMVAYRSAGLATKISSPASPTSSSTRPRYRCRTCKSGDLKAYAVTAKNRIAVAPDIPTTDEAGMPGYYFSFLARDVGAQGHAEGHHRQAQWRYRGGAGRSGHAQEIDSISPRRFIRPSSRRLRRCTRSRSRRSRSGGPSSKPPASRRSNHRHPRGGRSPQASVALAWLRLAWLGLLRGLFACRSLPDGGRPRSRRPLQKNRDAAHGRRRRPTSAPLMQPLASAGADRVRERQHQRQTMPKSALMPLRIVLRG